jgi:hypothetical protein
VKGAFMASLAISSATPTNVTQNQPVAQSSPAPTDSASRKPATLQPDTVKISLAAQAKLMHRQGQSISTIAHSLGTNVTEIDGYLSIKAAAQAAPAPTPAPAAESGHETQATAAAQPAPAAQATPTQPAQSAQPAIPTAPVAVETDGKAG